MTSNSEAVSDPTLCTLRAAITAANTNTAQGGCPARDGGTDTINLQQNEVYSFTSSDPSNAGNALPNIYTSMILNGNGSTIQRMVGASSIFRLVLIEGAPGGARGGGILFNSSQLTTLTLDHVTLRDNKSSTTNSGGAWKRAFLVH